MKELKVHLKNKTFENCYLFYGSENYLMKKYENQFIKTILDDSQKDMNLDIINDEYFSANDILAIVETYPFFASQRVVVIHNSNFFQKGNRKDEGAKLIPYIENLPNTCVLIFIEDKVEKNNALYKAVNKFHKVAEFEKLTSKDMSSWIGKELKKHKLTMSGATTNYFIENIDNSMEQVFNELQKLISFKFEGGEITINDINSVCSLSLESRVFELSNYVVAGNSIKACEIYKNLLSTKEQVFSIFYILIGQFRNIVIANSLRLEGRSNQEIATTLGLPPFITNKILNETKRFSLDDLKNIILLAQETDQNIKQGLIKDEVAVELFIIRLSSNLIS